MDQQRCVLQSDSKAINAIKKQLEFKLSKSDGYIVRTEVRWGRTSSRICFDLVVEKEGLIQAIFEVKNSVRGVESAISRMLSYVMGNSLAHFFIIYNSSMDKYLLFERKKVQSQGEHYTIDQIIDKIAKVERDNSDNGGDNDCAKLKFYQDSNKIFDSKFCREQLGELLPPNKICRYSSLDSVFCMLKYKTIRMNGLPGMNDKTEGLFVWELLNKLDFVENKNVKKRMAAINDAFIVSFSKKNKIDELTQWRLYGDDAKGVCCVYSVLKEKVCKRFFLHTIKYIDKNTDSENDSLLKALKDYVNKYNNQSFLDLSPIVYFYKTKAFKSEDEVRLLLDNRNVSMYNEKQYTRDWLLTNSNNIPNPYIDVKLNDIPLKLEKIILGPNMNDIDIVQTQLETMLEQQGIDATVECSKIYEYRNSMK